MAIFLIIAILLLLYNLVINLSNISNIVGYCFATNTLTEYWGSFFKFCFYGRAIYSSIIAFIIALFIFIIITPIILIRMLLFKGQVQKQVKEGLIFDYNDVQYVSNSEGFFKTNIENFGFKKNDYKIFGKIEQDVENVLKHLYDEFEAKGSEFKYEIMKEMYVLEKDKSAYAPLLITVDEAVFPVYFLYNDQQQDQYRSIAGLLSETRYKNTVFFSVK